MSRSRCGFVAFSFISRHDTLHRVQHGPRAAVLRESRRTVWRALDADLRGAVRIACTRLKGRPRYMPRGKLRVSHTSVGRDCRRAPSRSSASFRVHVRVPMVSGSAAWACAVAMSCVRAARRRSSRAMVSGQGRAGCAGPGTARRRGASAGRCSRLQFGVGLGQRQHGGVAGGDGFDLGVGELLAADVLGLAHGAVAGHDLGDEPGLGLQGLPHIGIEGAFGDVAVDRHFLVAYCPGAGSGRRAARPRRASTGHRDDAAPRGASGRWCRCPFSACCRAGRAPCPARTLLEQDLLLGVGVGIADGGDLLRGGCRAAPACR